jgi:hypothetical protein
MRFHTGEAFEKAELDGIIDILWEAMDGILPSHSILFSTFGTELLSPLNHNRRVQTASMERTYRQCGKPLDLCF